MGKRCRTAAWGATFALFVAACATTESTTPPGRASQTQGAGPSAAASESVDDSIPGSLASADTITNASTCASANNAAVSLFDISSGEHLWSTPIPPPGGHTVLHDNAVFLSFSWNQNEQPGVAAIDLRSRESRWERHFADEPEQLVIVGGALIVVTRNSIRALDLVTGADQWTIGSEFVFTEAIIDEDWAYAINTVAVHAINLRTGELTWQLPIERPDELAASGGLLAVAARNRILSVDTAEQAFLWDQQVNRLESGNMWIGSDAVIVELAPSESPSGGLAALDRSNGSERWRLNSVATGALPNASQLLTTVASPSFRGALQYDLISIDITTGERTWSVPTTIDADEGILSVVSSRALIYEPHPAVAGVRRLRLIDTNDGTVLWEVSSTQPIDGARIEDELFVSTHSSTRRASGNRGQATMILGPGRSWTIDTPGGIEQNLLISDLGAVVLSGERSPVCIGRDLFAPREIGASTGSSDRGEPAVSLRAG